MSFLITRTSRYGKKIAKFVTGLPTKIKKSKNNSFDKAFKSSAKAMGLGAIAVAGGFGLYGLSGQARKDQNVKIEMQKISKERRAGKRFTGNEISVRLNKAKQSKREFTWV